MQTIRKIVSPILANRLVDGASSIRKAVSLWPLTVRGLTLWLAAKLHIGQILEHTYVLVRSTDTE